jgi:hypothetical protein
LRASEVLHDTPQIDSILHHDGEERLVRLAAWLATGASSRTARPCEPAGDIDGITYRDSEGRVRYRPPAGAPALDGLATPLRRRPSHTLGYARAPLISSRGCSGACTFCSIRAWHRQVPAGRVRFRTPAAVADEMIDLHREHGVHVFVFHDDDFIHPDRRQARERCREILARAEQGIGAPFAFVVKCRPDDVEADLFGELREHGLVRAFVGIESGSQLGIRTLGRRVRPGDNERALATLRDLGIYSCFNLLLFHPDTTFEELEENFDFLARHRAHPFDVGRTELYARSALEDRMVRTGRATGDYRGYDYRLADARAEAVFQLYIAALGERHFGAAALIEHVQDLGYRLSLLRRFHPRLVGEELQARVDRLIRDVNDDTITWLRCLRDSVQQEGLAPENAPAVAPTRPSAASELVDAVRREVASRSRDQEARRRALVLELELRAFLGRLGVKGLPAVGAPRGLTGESRLAANAPRWLARAAALPVAAAVLGALACRGTTVCDPLPAPTIRFSTDIEPTLAGTCAIAGCHAPGSASGGLVLSAGSSYDQLIGVSSSELPTMHRVEPGRPDSSYVVNKLEGTQGTVGGSGAQRPKNGAPIPEFARKMRTWIARGAPRD